MDGDPLHGFGGWTVDAPANTTIQEIQFERIFSFAGPTNRMVWQVTKLGGGTLESVSSGTTPASGVVTLPVNAAGATGSLACSLAGGTGCLGGPGSSMIVTSKNFFVRISDLIEPTISATPPSATTPLRGTVEIPYEAQDVGSGVVAVFLTINPRPGNGGIIGESRDDNGGKCREPFKDLLPCKLEVKRSIAFDTTKVSNGPHTITLVAADSASNLTPTASFPVMIDNPRPPSPPEPGNGPGRGDSPNRGGALRPETMIAKHPPKRTSSRRAKFTFRSDKSSAHFECKLDRRRFKACRSPFKAKVKPGRHTFQVRALDASGSADLSPAVFRWRIS